MILKIDTSSPKLVKVSLYNQAEKLLKILEEENEYGSQLLLPLIMKVLASQGLALQDLTAIEVSPGPGSYTGLRVGASVAQALGFSLNIPVNGKLNKPVELKYT